VEPQKTLLVVGLRNPEPKRIYDRHNVGAQALFSLVKETINRVIKDSPSWMLRDDSLTLELNVSKKCRLVLVVANVSMNETGIPVKKVMDRYLISPDSLLVIQDDLDLPFGKLRIKKGSSDGGHRGIRSIIERIGTEEFMRLKIGIGRPPEGTNVLDFVLTPFTKEEKELLIPVFKSAGESIKTICRDGVEAAQNQISIDLKGEI
jgi:peptidyl-tRNA hydrolase, PTH1 family